MINWKLMVSRDFWTKKEISYQYVHFTNALLITYVMRMIYEPEWYFMLIGIGIGIAVELWQWINGIHKVEDTIRDLVFWTLGGVVGYFI